MTNLKWLKWLLSTLLMLYPSKKPSSAPPRSLGSERLIFIGLMSSPRLDWTAFASPCLLRLLHPQTPNNLHTSRIQIQTKQMMLFYMAADFHNKQQFGESSLIWMGASHLTEPLGTGTVAHTLMAPLQKQQTSDINIIAVITATGVWLIFNMFIKSTRTRPAGDHVFGVCVFVWVNPS